MSTSWSETIKTSFLVRGSYSVRVSMGEALNLNSNTAFKRFQIYHSYPGPVPLKNLSKHEKKKKMSRGSPEALTRYVHPLLIYKQKHTCDNFMMTMREICFSDEGDWGLNEGDFLRRVQVVFLSFSYGLDVQRNWNY